MDIHLTEEIMGFKKKREGDLISIMNNFFEDQQKYENEIFKIFDGQQKINSDVKCISIDSHFA
jgi:hypothetical protein